MAAGGAGGAAGGAHSVVFPRRGKAMSEAPRRGNPVPPLPRVRRTMIYWIGGLLGLLVLSGCKSDRLSEPFSAAINSMLQGRCGLICAHHCLDDRDLVPVRFLARSLSSGARVFSCPG